MLIQHNEKQQLWQLLRRGGHSKPWLQDMALDARTCHHQGGLLQLCRPAWSQAEWWPPQSLHCHLPEGMQKRSAPPPLPVGCSQGLTPGSCPSPLDGLPASPRSGSNVDCSIGLWKENFDQSIRRSVAWQRKSRAVYSTIANTKHGMSQILLCPMCSVQISNALVR